MKTVFRINETIKEIFSKPRVDGTIMFWGLPTTVAFGSCSFEGAIIISSILFLLCFFLWLGFRWIEALEWVLED